MAFRNLTSPLSRLFRPDGAPGEAPGGEPRAAQPGDAADHATAGLDAMSDGPELRRLAGLTRTAADAMAPSVELQARERMARLVDMGGIDLDALRAADGNDDAVLAIAALCADPGRLERAMSLIADHQQLLHLVTDGPSSRVRQLAAQRIDDPAELKELLRLLRGKDKSVYKIIQGKCDALRADEQRLAKAAADSEAACAALERLSHRPHDPLYDVSLRISIEQWHELEQQAGADVRARADAAIAACRTVADAHQRQLEERAAQQAAQAAAEAAQREAAARAAAEAQQRREAAAAAAEEARQQRAAQAAIEAEAEASHSAQLRQLTGLIARTNAALRDGDTSRAAGMRRSIEDKLPGVDNVPPHVARQIQQLDEKLAELKQWKDYAVAPKRAALIERMEALIGSTDAPQALADRIKKLQDEWKTISKGIVSDSEADWQRFHQASQTAYQPCRDYFEAQSTQRRVNLEKRSHVLQRVKSFAEQVDPESPDWKSIALVLREAPQEFHRPTPVDRAAGRRLQEEFDALIKSLRERIDSYYSDNAAEKKKLIERAKALGLKDEHREATDGIKKLQAQWKEVGAAEHREEQRLWQEFREQCDLVFAKRQKAFDDRSAGLEVNKAAAVALCEELEGIAALSGRDFVEAAARLPQRRDAFEALGELPRAEQRSLQSRFDRAVKQIQGLLAKQRTRDEEQSYAHVIEAARLIQSYGWAVAEAREASERETLKAAAERYIADVGAWPKGAPAALKEAWSLAERATAAAADANLRALRLLCIRSEILTERSTPQDDQTLRREHQVNRLMQRMGHGDDQGPDHLNSLLMEWVKVGAAPPSSVEPLRQRFLRCRSSNGQTM